MNTCKRCGANLPDEAKFCLQCGAAVDEPEAPVVSQKELDFVQPALTGGMFLGLLSSIPIINAGNCFCCMWILVGGGLAAFMLTKQRPGVRYGDGAFAGVLSGVIGAVVSTIISIPIRVIVARTLGSEQAILEERLRQIPELEGPLRDFFLRMASSEITVETIGFTLFSNLVLYSLFAMIGGILTIAYINRNNVNVR